MIWDPSKTTGGELHAGLSRRQVARRAALLAAPLLLASVLGVGLLYRRARENTDDLLHTEQQRDVRDAAAQLRASLELTASDVRYLASQSQVRRWANGAGTEAVEEVVHDFQAFSRERMVYDQVRLLDAEGREIVRVDDGLHGPQPRPASELGDRRDRYYVPAVLALPANHVYVSPLDLNVEHGEVETPWKPTIRVGCPIYDDDGALRGMVLVNHSLRERLETLRGAFDAAAGELFLVNEDGYFLVGPSHDQELTFMFPDAAQYRFGDEYADAWQKILRAPAGETETDDANWVHVWVGARGAPMGDTDRTVRHPRDASESWVLVGRLTEKAVTAQMQGARVRWGIILLALLSLIAVGATWLARGDVRRTAHEAALQANETRLRGFLLAAPDAIVISDAKGRIRFFSEQAERLLGYTAEEVLGRPIDELVPDSVRDGHSAHRREYLAAPRLGRMSSRPVLTARCKDGTEVFVSIMLAPLQTKEGLLVFSTLRDATERRLQEERVDKLHLELLHNNEALVASNRTLDRQAAQLSEANAELEAFSYSVSHDLRGPLRGIDGFSRVLVEKHGSQLDETANDYLGRIRAAAQRMGALIDDLLQLSRVGRRELTMKRVDLSALSRDVIDELEAAGPTRAVEWTIAQDLVVKADPDLVRVVLINLLGNAWKYSGSQPKAHIELGSRRGDHGETIVFVRDDGVGFDMKYSGKLFVPFERLHGQNEFPGTGIGLALVHRIIDRHHGRIWAESIVGVGSTFFFTLAPPDSTPETNDVEALRSVG